MSRPSKDITWMRVARTISQRATCLRRKVGCVLLDARGHVLSTGYNGVAPGEPHCNEIEFVGSRAADGSGNRNYPNACPGAFLKTGVGLDQCYAVHAEQNALLQCKDPWQIHVCYTTTSPCMTCVKLLLATSCVDIVFCEEYVDTKPRDLWLKAGRSWREVSIHHIAAAAADSFEDKGFGGRDRD
jgi:dCMP deaminase